LSIKYQISRKSNTARRLVNRTAKIQPNSRISRGWYHLAHVPFYYADKVKVGGTIYRIKKPPRISEWFLMLLCYNLT
jgi:hypothetical protein